jgi:galactonate dehydratase
MHFVAVAPHNPWSWVNTVASLHLDAVTPNFLIQEVLTEPEPWKDAVVKNFPKLESEGYFALPTGPGLGIELDLEAAARFPPVTGRPPVLWHEDGSVADW